MTKAYIFATKAEFSIKAASASKQVAPGLA